MIDLQGAKLVDRMVERFAGVTEMPLPDAEMVMVFAMRLSFLRWLRERMQKRCAEWDGSTRPMLAELRRELQVVGQKAVRMEGVLGAMRDVTERPLPEWMTAEMMTWASEARHEQQPESAFLQP